MAGKKQTNRKRTRPEPLSRDSVLQAAMDYADQHGIESLSMRKLGQLLGVEAMSLYNHVPNKDAILDGMVDQVAGEMEIPVAGGDWRRAMRRRAFSAHEVLLRHPWATMLIVSRVNVGPAMLRYVDATIGCLVEAGFSDAMADHAWNALDSFTYGFTLQKLKFPFHPDDYAKVAEAYLPQIPADQYPYLHGMSQAVIAGHHNGLHDLTLGLDLILDGLERLRTS
ncbi:TetR/AcrR family transcriptional regulator C-terminal domain-containing protein [Rhodopirellula sp. JC639]|uniref:TetR/AcrR family transcriptional regulator C-terminal domain-containing protein n=1 Tax=Stieleria mannarensis TaxID=2755585 RepID=UPI0015FECC2D|nr:TetR/AcrR family transcriptional regulator C-terminal domain-containing protein [Rhodopirellula sp. JC639]